MLRLSEGSDPGAKCNEYYGLFAAALLPGWFCSPELHCRAVLITLEPLPSSDWGCLRHEPTHTAPLSGALEIAPASTVRITCPASSSGAQAHFFHPFGTHRAGDEFVTCEEFVLGLKLQHRSLKWIEQGIESNFGIKSQ